MLYLPRYWRSPAGEFLALLGLLLSWSAATPLRGAPAEAPSPEQPKVTAVRFWSSADTTRIAIEATGQFQFRSDRLQNPERLFFDLVGARPQIGPKGVQVISVGDRLIRQIRVAETLRGVTRVVLDLSADVKFSTSQLANPDRLIIEVHPAKDVQPVAQFQPPAGRTPEQPRPLPVAVEPPPDPSLLARRGKTRLSSPDPLASLAATLPLPQPPAPANLDPMPVRTPPLTTSEVGLPAKRTPRAGNTMTRVLGLKLRRVVLDAGHGGNDAGTSGPDGLREKDVALDVAKRLGALIQDRLGSEVIYTRTDDTFVPLGRRTAIANEANADLFLSIHVNSSPIRAASGVETYYLSFTTSHNALETAARENAGAEQNIHELQDLLRQIALKDKVDESREFAARIQNSLGVVAARVNHGSKDRGVKKAPFVVLIGATMPAVLVEIGFITNSQDELMMRRGDQRQRIADALYKGLASYANSLSHFQVAQSGPAGSASSSSR